MNRVEVYFTDISPQKQAEILELYGENIDYSTFPIVIFEGEEEAEPV